MSADEIALALESIGQKRSTTTVRHHLEILRTAGLAEVSRMVETRGTVMKYYSPRLYPFNSKFDELNPALTRIVDNVSKKLAKLLTSISSDKKFGAIQIEKTRCTLCKNDHSRTALIINIVDMALARALQNLSLSEKLGKLKGVT
jgi:DNA-binding transcriptional ArsR family regulator